MTRDEFKILAKGMKAVYAQATFMPDQDAFNVWYSLLKDLPYDQASMAVQKHMMTEKFPPTIADIRSAAASVAVRPEDEMTELQAWAVVYKAITRSNYYAEEEFEKLPQACKLAVGSPANLRAWAMMDNETIESVEQSHFVKSYRGAVKRLKDDAMLSDSFRQRLEEKKREILSLKEEAVAQLAGPGETEGEEVTGMPGYVMDKLDRLKDSLAAV